MNPENNNASPDHRALLKTLTPDARRQLTRRSDRAGLKHLAGHWGLIAALATAIPAVQLTLSEGPAWTALLTAMVMVQGILIVFLFTLLHETIHLTPFRSLWLNRAVGMVCGFLLFLPPHWFRQFHNAHHKFTNIPGKDPELASPAPATRAAYLWHLTGLPLWWGHGRTLIGNAMGRADEGIVIRSHRAAVQREAWMMILAYLVLLILSAITGSTIVFWCWILPILLGQPFLRAYLLAEHGDCPHVDNMLANSRTMKTNAMIRFLAWNMPYHAEHHAWPAVPFHKLPAFHAVTRPHLQVTGDGYFSFHRQMWRQLQRG